MAVNPPLLEVQNLRVHFSSRSGWFGPRKEVRAVDDVSLSLDTGETLGIVGESGCGKSTLAQAIMGLVPVTAGRIAIAGNVWMEETAEVRRKRAAAVQMVFQDPQSSLDPRMRVWGLVTEPLAIHGEQSGKARRQAAAQLLSSVGLGTAHMDRFPHEFSGGQRQRISIARALALKPRLLILDEPTSALDISVQAQILNLLLELQQREGLSYLFISHDIGVVRHIADRVAVMHMGKIVEEGSAADVLANPQHQYTRDLLDAVPSVDRPRRRVRAS